MRTVPALILAAAVLAGCASPPPPSAAQIARRFPGCRPVNWAPMTSVFARQEVACTPGIEIQVATFSSDGMRLKWIESQGKWDDQCCVVGPGWAATVDSAYSIMQWKVKVAKALGGRVVSYP